MTRTLSSGGERVQYLSASVVKNWVWYVADPFRSDWRMISAPASSTAWTSPNGASAAMWAWPVCIAVTMAA